MGQDITKDHFTDDEYRIFSNRLEKSLIVLRDVINQPGFGQGPLSLGAEMEAYITTPNGDTSPINRQLIDQLKHPQLQLELNRYNIEYNLSPVALTGKPFSLLENESQTALNLLQNAARQHGSQIVPIGILPTLCHSDLTRSAMTDLPRYRALSSSLNKIRGTDFEINIHGDDHIQLTSSNVVLEGANTSFQIHLRVEPDRFADTFNTIQLVTPLVLALSANSPYLLNKRLWEETRIALFKQSVDHRMRNTDQWHEPARVAFGQGWVRNNAWELFAETVALHRPIIPALSAIEPKFDPQGNAPELSELKFHMGTVWPWNRAVYDSSAGGHLRIEMRALPSGPTIVDMVANMAFYVGLAIGLRGWIRDWMPSIPFAYAEYNFYRSAQHGLDATLLWPHRNKHRIVETPLTRVLEMVIPYAYNGLSELGVDSNDIHRYLSVIEQRFEKRLTPSAWQQHTVNHYKKSGDNVEQALRKMFQHYCEEQATENAITDWAWLS